LVQGRFGQVAHELHEIEAHEGSIRAGGAFFGTTGGDPSEGSSR
jgi:hypothetical protein